MALTMSRLTAFNDSGRFSVIQAIWSLTSYNTFSSAMGFSIWISDLRRSLSDSFHSSPFTPHDLFDHFIRPRQHIGRNRQADLFCCLEIDDQFKFLRLLDRQFGGLSAFQNLVHIRSSAPVQVGEVHAVGHEPPGFHIFWLVVCRREPVLCRKFYNLCSLSKEDRAPQHEDCFSTPLAASTECALNILGT